ncbi:MAG: pseudouridine synthase [Candidatus Uhrbacteria bacterium]
MQERIQKVLSRVGVASRRHAEAYIRDGRVTVNGVLATIGQLVDAATDVLVVDGVRIANDQSLHYVMMYKPRGYAVTRDDPHAAHTVFELLPEALRSHVWYVGRLDLNSEGLLLFTNDGALTQELTHPSFAHEKEYIVTVTDRPTTAQGRALRSGVMLDDGMASASSLSVHGQTIHLVITEGRKRQVRRMCMAAGMTVERLVRVRMGGLQLPDDLKSGEFRMITREDVLPSAPTKNNP